MFHLSRRVLTRINSFRRVPRTPLSASFSSTDQSTIDTTITDTTSPTDTDTDDTDTTDDTQDTQDTQDPQVFMDTVDETFLSHEHTIAQLCSSTHPPFAVIDDFFEPSTIHALRTEAVRLRDNGHFVTSQSERNGVTYEKHNVEAMQLDGGDQYFDGAW
jgi:hypothetical protein